MPEKKDFLSQFSTENKPDSFKEEERVKVVKERKPFNPLFVIIPVVVLIVAGLLVYLFLFRPNIEVVDFTGQSKNDATAWLKQQEIESTGIIFKEEYNFDVDKDVIISQNPETGKVTKKAKITYVVSKGADPDESVKVPDFVDMDKDEISNWIKINKLVNTKINTTYDDIVEKDQFIKADYSGCDADSFTRGCSLKISISKGKKPEDEIIMANYVGKTYAEMETWATSKKIKLEKYEAYSDYYESGLITYQSVKATEKVKAGDTINVTVSKGKAVRAGNFINSKLEDVQYWATKNGARLVTKYEYNSNYGVDRIISQSIAEKGIVEDDLVVYVSLGNPRLDNPSSYTLESLREWKNTQNEKGADLHTGDVTYVNSDTVPVGHVISVESTNVGARMNPVISLGKNLYVVDKDVSWAEAIGKTEEQIRKLCSDNGLNYTVQYEKEGDGTKINTVLKIELIAIDGSISEIEYSTFANHYVSEAEVIVITICDGAIPE